MVFIPLVIYIIIINLVSNVLASTAMVLLKTWSIFYSNLIYTILGLALGLILILLGFKGLEVVIVPLLAQTAFLLFLLHP